MIPETGENNTIEMYESVSFPNEWKLKKVLIPNENTKDLIEVPEAIKKQIQIIPVRNVDEVLKVSLTKQLKRVEWVEVDQIQGKNKTKSSITTRDIN